MEAASSLTEYYRNEIEVCIQDCMECLRQCEICKSESQKDTMVHLMMGVIKSCRDCTDCCSICARFLSRNSELLKHITTLCYESCIKCAEQCEKFNFEHTMNCAEVCRKCAESCKKINLVFN